MTIEEAKNILINRGFVEINGDQVFDGNKWRNAITVISKWLEQEPCEDVISRQAVMDVLGDSINDDKDYHRAVVLLNNLPSVTPKEKTGRWISFGIQGEIDGQIVRAFTCSKCGAISIFRVSNGNIVNGDLCPNCGAKMVEP